CFGFQRKDMEPAPATICTNPACRLLFIRRQDSGRDCPQCASSVSNKAAPRVVAPRRSRAKPVLGLLLLGALVGVAAYVLLNGIPFHPSPLVVTPAVWKGPVGSELSFKVIRNSAYGKKEDVSALVVPVSEDLRIARVEKGGTRIFARSHGKT